MLASLTLFLLAAGVSHALSLRSFQGTFVEEGQYTYIVSVLRNGKHVNVGTIIHPRVVLTEAYNFDNCTTAACGGAIRSNSVNAISGGTVREALQVTIHENYDNPHNDIALIKVESPFLTEAQARLPEPFQKWSKGTTGLTFGWGGFLDTDLMALKQATVTVESDKECSDRKLDMWFAKEQFCAVSDIPNSGLCDGDYGSPMIVHDDVVAGIAVNLDCAATAAQAMTPDQYLDLVPLLPWIQQHLEQC